MSPVQARQLSPHALEVNKLHEKMYREFQSRANEIARDVHCRQEFMKRFDQLVGQLERLAQDVSSEEEFNWLTTVSRQWEEKFFSVLREPRHLRAEIGISVPPPGLEPAYRPLSDESVRAYLGNKANEVARGRKLTQLFRRWAELRSHPDRIHAEIPSTPEEMREDWYWATVCFAAEVLEGRIGFAHRIGAELYPSLENVWLEDVKRLKAYLLWEQDGSHWQPDGGKKYFFQATDVFRGAALGSSLKASPTSFARAELYLDQLYLSGGVIDPTHDATAHRLIAEKAQRIWQHSGRHRDTDANWGDAERYVRGFYEHIIPAVKEADRMHIAAVAEAFCSAHRGRMPCDIVNCFEAALVIYFADAAKLHNACGSDVHLLF